MHPLFIVGLTLAGITALAMPFYCKITFAGKSQQTLYVKMFLSSLFMLTAILSIPSQHARHGFIYVMLFAFAVDLLGDYLLGKSDDKGIFLLGSACFAVGHLLNVVAFSIAGRLLTPQVGWLNGLEFGLFLSIACVMLLILLLKKPPFDPMLAAMFVYCLLVTLLFVKAAGLAIRLADRAPLLVMLPVGAACFLVSDYMLAMMRFKLHEKTFAFKSVCTVSYYAAQMLLALSMFTLIRL